MNQSILVNQEDALEDFLDQLLDESDDSKSTDVSQEAVLQTVETASETEVEPQPEAAQASEPEDITPPVLDEKPNEAASEQVRIAMELADDGGHDRIPVIPDWGLRPFQAMVFKVFNLSLAIPVTELGGVIEWQPEKGNEGMLKIGEKEHNQQQLTIIDLASLITTPDWQERLNLQVPEERISRVILINDGKLGLACDSVHEVLTLQPERIRWRSTKTRRQWLAGTILDDLIVVLDVGSTSKIVMALLEQADKG